MQIFVNLPVKDLKKSIDFFTKVGFTFNAEFTDENATCMILSEHHNVMLLAEPFFRGFTKQEVCDTSKANEVLIALSVESKHHVNDVVHKAIAAGGTHNKGMVDHGFMFVNDFKDLDGHIWELFHMSGNPQQ